MAEPHIVLNTASVDQARALLTRCCGARRWVEQMLQLRPFDCAEHLYAQARIAWETLAEPDQLEAFAHHPRIGEDMAALRARFANTARLSSQEQAGVEGADEPTLTALRDLNRSYFERHGFVFLIFATGKSAQQMLAALRERLPNTRTEELHNAAQEQAKIMLLRLEKLAS